MEGRKQGDGGFAMRSYGASRRSRALWIVVAGSVGYVIGGWQAATPRSELSPSQAVALRFPENLDTTISDDSPALATASAPSGVVLGDLRLALLSPTPMVMARESQARLQVAAAEVGTIPPLPAEAAPPRPAPAVVQSAAAAKPPGAAARRHSEQRPGFLLNDAQIASIKERLHLTPDQERMWPGVEAALRNIAYAKARDGRGRGSPAGADASALAALSPDSAEVQDLKSAAIPLIMSFSEEQKGEVRSLAHVMGLDRLASEL
jgi:hypothetical protein